MHSFQNVLLQLGEEVEWGYVFNLNHNQKPYPLYLNIYLKVMKQLYQSEIYPRAKK